MPFGHGSAAPGLCVSNAFWLRASPTPSLRFKRFSVRYLTQQASAIGLRDTFCISHFSLLTFHSPKSRTLFGCGSSAPLVPLVFQLCVLCVLGPEHVSPLLRPLRLCSANLQLHRILRKFSGDQNEGISTFEKFAASAFCPLRPSSLSGKVLAAVLERGESLCVFAFKCLWVAALPRRVFAFQMPLVASPFLRFCVFTFSHFSVRYLPQKTSAIG
jgi:hypothetical protein